MMTIKTIYESVVPHAPLLCVIEKQKLMDNFIIKMVVEHAKESVVILCGNAHRRLDMIERYLKFNRRHDFYVEYNSIVMDSGKRISAYQIGNETRDVFMEEDEGILMFDQVDNIHPIVLRGLIERNDDKRILCGTTSSNFSWDFKKVIITSHSG